MKLKAEVVTITPKLAEDMLAKSKHDNRRLDRKRVEFFAEQMTAGKWMLNGQPILMNGTELLDGQHRLRAVVKSGTPIQAMLVSGVDSEAYNTIDTGRSRSHADILQANGYDNVNVRAAVSRLSKFWMDGNLSWGKRKTTYISHSELVEFCEKFSKRLNDAVSFAVVYRGKGPDRGILVGSHMGLLRFAAHKQTEKLTSFAEGLRSGAGLKKESAVLALREKFVSMIGARTSAGKISPLMRLALTIKAWNYHLHDRKCEVVRIGKNEIFPAIVCD